MDSVKQCNVKFDSHTEYMKKWMNVVRLFPAQTGIVKRLDRASDNKAHAQTVFNERFQNYTRTRTGGKNELKTPTYGRGGK